MQKSFESYPIVRLLLALYCKGWPVDRIVFVDAAKVVAKVILEPGCSVIVGLNQENQLIVRHFSTSLGYRVEELPDNLLRPGLLFDQVVKVLQEAGLYRNDGTMTIKRFLGH